MKIEFLFSSNNKIGSKIISMASRFEKHNHNKTPSHVAVLMNGSLIAESTLFTGVRLIPYTKWLEKNNQIARVDYVGGRVRSDVAFDILMGVWGRPYDWPGIAYFAWSYIKLILAKIPMEEVNLWESNDKYFCTEYASIMSGIPGSMLSPSKMLKIMTK